MVKRMNYKVSEKSSKYFEIFGLCCMVVILLWSILRPYIFMEVDSYALPVISIQSRGSIVMTSDDIARAKIDFPSLYGQVNTFDDLRSAKLNKLDDNHWMAYYFPVYAFFCLPIKLLLQFLKLNQEYCFAITNALSFCAVLMYIIKKRIGARYFLLMLISPVWAYLYYIGAEPVMFSASILVMLLWKQKKFKRAIIVSSVIAMLNPTYIGVGGFIFIDYFIVLVQDAYRGDKTIRGILGKMDKWNAVLAAGCFFPFFIPFLFNLIKLGTLNPTIGIIARYTVDTWADRVFAYFFDMNLGLASISPVIPMLFIAATIYALVKVNVSLICKSCAAIGTIILFAAAVHINSGMLGCARYVLWIYPVAMFTIIEFFDEILRNRKVIESVVVAVVIFSEVFIAYANKLYPYVDFSNVSKKLMDEYPQAYISFCDSTFNSRANGIDGGYGVEYAIYCDSKTGEIRKVLYNNSEKWKHVLAEGVATSENGVDSIGFESLLKTNSDNKNYYINVDKNSDTQYYVNWGFLSVYRFIENFYSLIGFVLDDEEYLRLAKLYYEDKEKLCDELTDAIEKLELSNIDYVHYIYIGVLQRHATQDESDYDSDLLESGVERRKLLYELINSKEFTDLMDGKTNE